MENSIPSSQSTWARGWRTAAMKVTTGVAVAQLLKVNVSNKPTAWRGR